MGALLSLVALLQSEGLGQPVLTWREIKSQEQAQQASIRDEARDSVDYRVRRDRKVAAKRVAAIQRRARARTAQEERQRQLEFDRAMRDNGYASELPDRLSATQGDYSGAAPAGPDSRYRDWQRKGAWDRSESR